jgi:hypothetical protein
MFDRRGLLRSLNTGTSCLSSGGLEVEVIEERSGAMIEQVNQDMENIVRAFIFQSSRYLDYPG